MSDKKKIWISIKGKTTQEDGPEDIVELITQGEIYKKRKSDYIIYDETQVSGLEGTTTTLKIDDNKIAIIRLGSTNSHMIFEKGKKNFNTYSTPYGDMSMMVYTKAIDINYNSDNNPTNIYVDYNIEIQGLASTRNVLNIEVKH
ncbi:DUF1934 family protein [Alkalibaculum sp. M08DMB]|uniref:DUF1934 family protein n=1 Tax=Alkalibaculum sporogenes TaxID=2655001 RepID=A0A6A7KCS2_9FIRM|nr:DUF1934 domain-containing protein [Alkalibaculum sporogenes]MPW27206.1 DUF1934 family protein [Alkalibaculum sporogenes]